MFYDLLRFESAARRQNDSKVDVKLNELTILHQYLYVNCDYGLYYI